MVSTSPSLSRESVLTTGLHIGKSSFHFHHFLSGFIYLLSSACLFICWMHMMPNHPSLPNTEGILGLSGFKTGEVLANWDELVTLYSSFPTFRKGFERPLKYGYLHCINRAHSLQIHLEISNDHLLVLLVHATLISPFIWSRLEILSINNHSRLCLYYI